jgi:hypothetical protein
MLQKTLTQILEDSFLFSIFVSENLIKISLSLIVTLVSPRVI